jgi:benzoate/toluate 1,2-dioxygenase subunit beta
VSGLPEPGQHAVEQFLYREARLMDGWLLKDWLGLWDADGEVRYWVPSLNDDLDPDRQVSIVYDDWARLNDRIARLESAGIHVQSPRSRLCRSVTNVEIRGRHDDVTTVESSFVLGEFRNEVQSLYLGRTIHDLALAGERLLMRSKKVLLLNNSGFLGNLTFLL